jgi:Domain of unknown function (DUF4276)
MKKSLVLALFAEGASDNRFLPPIILRTAEELIAKYGQDTVDVLEPVIVPKPRDEHRHDCILAAARYACGYHALVVHSDADDRTSERAKAQRIQPGFDLVSSTEEMVCKHLIPIIPVQMVEAWMLADDIALREIIGTEMSPQNLGLPSRPALVEIDANPKETLNGVIRRATSNYPARRRQLDFVVVKNFWLVGSILGRYMLFLHIGSLQVTFGMLWWS